MFSTIPNGIRKVSDSQGYKEMQDQQELLLQQLIQDSNKVWDQIISDPEKAFNYDALLLSAMQQTNKDMVGAQYADSKINYFDAVNDMEFGHFGRTIERGAGGQFREMLRDLNRLSDENFANAFEISLDEVAGKREGIQQAMRNLEVMQENYDRFNDKFPNPVDPSIYEPGSDEFIDAALTKIAHKTYRDLYMYSRQGFGDAVKRTNDIMSKLRSEGAINITKEKTAKERIEKGVVGYAFSDLTTLLDPNSIKAEIKLLSDEIETLTAETADPENKILAENKQLGKDKLQAYLDVITDPKRQNENGVFDSSKKSNIKALKKALLEYLGDNVIDNQFLAAENIDDVVAMIADYATLDNRALMYNQAIEVLLNPDNFNRILAKMRVSVRDVFNNRKEILRKNLESEFRNKKVTEALTALMEMGIVVSPEDSKSLLKLADASVIENLYTEGGLLTREGNPEIFDFAMQVLVNFQNMRAAEEAAIAEREAAVGQDVVEDVTSKEAVDILEANGIKTIPMLH